jgi:OOP family OmpA-OmpF porin
MKKKPNHSLLRVACCMIFAACAAPSLAADNEPQNQNKGEPVANGWYIGAEGGVNWTPGHGHADALLYGPGGATQQNFSYEYGTGWVGGLTTGYSFSSGFRPELELAYRRNNFNSIDVGGGSVNASGNAGVETAFANLWYDLKLRNSIFQVLHPYLGIGGGAARVNFRDLGPTGGPTITDDHDTKLAYQAGAGFTVDVAPRLIMSVDYRYIGTERLTLNYASGIAPAGSVFTPFSTTYTANSVMLGLRLVLNKEQLRTDSDGDGVPDDRDQCPNTPPGTPVDSKGCPLDSDHDGVPDNADQCPNTQAGVSVDAKGCPLDSDSDGVPDYQDQCPNTPAGTQVDAKGCPIPPPVQDSDHDGVPDDHDQCPNTPTGEKVMANGCSASQALVLRNVHFSFGKATVRPDSKTVLNEVAKTIKESPGFKIEIGGYTDNVGSNKANLKLSQARADAVRAYLVGQGVPSDTIVAKGYGEANPIADNKTEDGRAQNRRVEMHVVQ